MRVRPFSSCRTSRSFGTTWHLAVFKGSTFNFGAISIVESNRVRTNRRIINSMIVKIFYGIRGFYIPALESIGVFCCGSKCRSDTSISNNATMLIRLGFQHSIGRSCIIEVDCPENITCINIDCIDSLISRKHSRRLDLDIIGVIPSTKNVAFSRFRIFRE